jgi:hypothetical protein
MPTSTTSSEVRAKLVDALKLDLVGPWPARPLANELLPENPTRWYLTGYLVPDPLPLNTSAMVASARAVLACFRSPSTHVHR